MVLYLRVAMIKRIMSCLRVKYALENGLLRIEYDLDQGCSRHGARGQLFPPLRFQCSPQMGSAQITAVTWQWGNCLSRLLLCQSHSLVTLCRSASLYSIRFILLWNQLNSRGVACLKRACAPLHSQSPRGHCHRGPAKCFDT